MIKKVGLPLCLFLLIAALLVFPSLCIQAASQGLLLWFNKIIPSLLPFIILMNILIHINVVDRISRLATPLTRLLWKLPGISLFAFIIGLVAGYPMGGKIIKELVQTQKLSPSEAHKTLCFCNNCGPLFIVGTIGTVMLNNISYGYFLVGIHFLSAFVLSLLHRPVLTTPSSKTFPNQTSPSNTSSPFSKLFNEAVMNSMDTIVCIGGYIIFFSVITHLLNDTGLIQLICNLPLLRHLSHQQVSATLSGLLELSNGAYSLSSSSIAPEYKLALLSGIIGFGGYCVYFQTLYVLDDTPISTSCYFLSKGLQGVICFTLAGMLYPFFFMYTENTSSLFQFYCLLSFTMSTLLYTRYIHFTQKRYTTSIAPRPM